MTIPSTVTVEGAVCPFCGCPDTEYYEGSAIRLCEGCSESWQYRHDPDARSTAAALLTLTAAELTPEQRVEIARQIAPDGWAVVPREPTARMEKVGALEIDRCWALDLPHTITVPKTYRAMIEAAQPEGGE